MAVLLVGCATRGSVGPEIAARSGRPGIVVAAPLASSEAGTGEMATEIARRNGFGMVIAASSDDAYERRVRDAAHGPLVFYAEIRGHARGEADRVEIGTVGVDGEQAAKLRTLFELVRDAHLRARPGGLRLTVRVEPADPVTSAGVAGRRAGIWRVPQRALHIELPRVAREGGRELYTSILADFLREASALPLPVRR